MQKKYAELREKILDPTDLVLFNEVIGTMEGNFYRSSYIMSWINIIESLKRKLYELSGLNDSRAKSAVEMLENLEKKNQSTDRAIFENSVKCEIIPATDESAVNFLWQQRCIFAHPYNKSPTNIELDFIINQSVELVLSKGVNFNKEYLKQFCENIISKPHLVDSDENKLLELSGYILMRTKENLHPFYFKTLFYHYCVNGSKPTERRKIEIFIKDLIEKTSLDLHDSIWEFEQRVIDYPAEFFLCIINLNFWIKIDNRIKDVLTNFLVDLYDYNLLAQLSSMFGTLQSAGALEVEYSDKFFKKLDGLSFSYSIHYYGSNDKQFERIIKELKSWQFNQQDEVVKFINSEYSSKILNGFSRNQNIMLGSVLNTAAQENHYKSKSLIDLNYMATSKLNKEIFIGVIAGHFINLNDEARFDKEKGYLAVKALNELDNSSIQVVYDIIFNILDNKKAKHDWDVILFGDNTMKNFKSAVNQLNLDWNEVNWANYQLLEEKVNRYFDIEQNENKIL